MAESDKLTGFMTQKTFMDNLEHEVLRVKRYKGELSLLLLEINYDYFEKQFDLKLNLSYWILRQMARLLRTKLRDVDSITRYDGDTIAIMLPETNEPGAKVVAERLRSALENHLFAADERKISFKVALSIGVATFKRHAKTSKELVAAAQKALKAALAKGGNCFEVSPIVLEETYSN